MPKSVTTNDSFFNVELWFFFSRAVLVHHTWQGVSYCQLFKILAEWP